MEENKQIHPADTNGDGKVSKEEHDLYLEFKRKELDDQDVDHVQRKMVYFCNYLVCCYIHLPLCYKIG